MKIKERIIKDYYLEEREIKAILHLIGRLSTDAMVKEMGLSDKEAKMLENLYEELAGEVEI